MNRGRIERCTCFVSAGAASKPDSGDRRHAKVRARKDCALTRTAARQSHVERIDPVVLEVVRVGMIRLGVAGNARGGRPLIATGEHTGIGPVRQACSYLGTARGSVGIAVVNAQRRRVVVIGIVGDCPPVPRKRAVEACGNRCLGPRPLLQKILLRARTRRSVLVRRNTSLVSSAFGAKMPSGSCLLDDQVLQRVRSAGVPVQVEERRVGAIPAAVERLGCVKRGRRARDGFARPW